MCARKKTDPVTVVFLYFFLKFCYKIGLIILLPFTLFFAVLLDSYRGIVSFYRLIVHFIFRLMFFVKKLIPYLKIFLIALFAIFLSYKTLGILNSVPYPTSISEFVLPPKITIYDRNKKVLYESNGFFYRIPVSVDTLSAASLNMLVPESKPKISIAKKVARNYLLFKGNSIRKEIQENLIALKLVFLSEKKDLISLYLNTSPFADEAIGIETAAFMYFGKHTTQLNKSELVFLSSFLDSDKPKRTKPLFAIYKRAPVVVDHILEILVRNYGKLFIQTHGLIVNTTIDLSLQNETQQAFLESQNQTSMVIDDENSIAAVIASGPSELKERIKNYRLISSISDGNGKEVTSKWQNK